MTSLPKYSCILLLVVLLLSTACTRHYDERLEALNSVTDTAPDSALAALMRIDTLKLSERDANYHRFLGIKLRDKAYISHSSDTTILRVLDYSYSHDKDLYPEALYYGGRVYSDLGDYPTALRYFQDALDLLPEESSQLKLRGNVLSQTARLLNELRLYSQAAEYLTQTVEIDSILKDSLNIMYDTQLLGAVYLHSDQSQQAEKLFSKSLELAREFSSPDTVLMRMYLATAKYNLQDIDSSKYYISPLVKLKQSEFYPNVLEYASFIYKNSDEQDSAFIFAKELISFSNPLYKRAGFEILLSPEYSPKLAKDTVLEYSKTYQRLIENYLNNHDSQEALMQDAMYNYRQHDLKRIAAEQYSKRLSQWINSIIIVILLLTIVLLYLQYSNKRNQLQLRQALDKIQTLKSLIETQDTSVQDLNNTTPSTFIAKSDKEIMAELRTSFLNEIKYLEQTVNGKIPLNQNLIFSSPYAQLLDCVSEKRIINDNDTLWTELEKTILIDNPNFTNNLIRLSSGRIKQYEIQMAILIKCGIAPGDIANIIGRSNPTVVFRRKALCKKLFGEDLGVKTIDAIIHLM